jgi:hypothetical protein
MAKSKAPVIQNTNDLRKMLIETIQSVRTGELDAKQARTIATLSTTILHSAKLDLDFLRFHAANETVSDESKNVLQLIA